MLPFPKRFFFNYVYMGTGRCRAYRGQEMTPDYLGAEVIDHSELLPGGARK